MKKVIYRLTPIILVALGITGFLYKPDDNQEDAADDNGPTYIQEEQLEEPIQEVAEEEEETKPEVQPEEKAFIRTEEFIVTQEDVTSESEAYELVISDLDEGLAGQIDNYDAFVSTIKAFLYIGDATKDHVTVRSFNNMKMDADGNKIYTMGIPEYGNYMFEIRYVASDGIYEIAY